MARFALWILFIALTAAPAAHGQGVPVDLELAFVVDASGSIDAEETRLQRQGYADALANPRVLGAVTGGYLRAIAVAFIEFAGAGCERLSVPWSRIANRDDAKAFGARILDLPRAYCPGGNAIGDALAFASESIESNAFEGTRRVIDISGDGPNTVGQSVELARDWAVAQRITVNGLVIDRPSMPELELYFREAVTGGARSFVIKADDRRSFAAAILKKLIIEIAATGPLPK